MGIHFYTPVVVDVIGNASFRRSQDNFRILRAGSNEQLDTERDWSYCWSAADEAFRFSDVPASVFVNTSLRLLAEEIFAYRDAIVRVHENVLTASKCNPRHYFGPDATTQYYLAQLQLYLDRTFDRFFADHPKADHILALATADTITLEQKLRGVNTVEKRAAYHDPFILVA